LAFIPRSSFNWIFLIGVITSITSALSKSLNRFDRVY
jgi:hypothetical protein